MSRAPKGEPVLVVTPSQYPLVKVIKPKTPNKSSSKGKQNTEDTRSSLAGSVCIESASSSGADEEDAGSSSAESVQIKSASSSYDSSEEREGGNRQGPHKRNGPSAHRGAEGGARCALTNCGLQSPTPATGKASPQGTQRSPNLSAAPDPPPPTCTNPLNTCPHAYGQIGEFKPSRTQTKDLQK